MGMARQHTLRSAKNSGFTMVELAIVVAVISVLLAGALVMTAPLMKTAQVNDTREKLNRIAKALSLYAVTNYRIPCPAKPNRTMGGTPPPFGYENGSGATGAATPDGCPAGLNSREGIVPFKTLGLSEAMVKDAWGNFFTYAVSPAFTWNTKLGTNPATIHPTCRTQEWMFDSYIDADGDVQLRNRSPDKARFCCPGVPDTADATDGDLIINEGDPPTWVGLTRVSGAAPTDLGYDTVDELTPRVLEDDAESNPAGDTILNCPAANPADPCWDDYYISAPRPPKYVTSNVPAFVIVSHGANGRGVYIVDGGAAGTKANTTSSASQREYDNMTADKSFSDYPYFFNDTANPYDDLMIWRTQEQMFAEYGGSCNLP
ncbi:MAG: prepilin-type N-terminal cleavage/methylation domain-containing protein [Alphaproteobacteria bacterium]|nr:prepilin-type N-terminal cleavage/methylation domain-containing protein [Alphaproteobacteria bacterium]